MTTNPLRRLGLAGLVLASVTASLLAGCAALGPKLVAPTLEVGSVSFIGGDLKHQTLRVHLLVDNPNARELAVRAIDYRVALAGTELAQGTTEAPFTIPASGRGEFDLNVATDLGSALRVIAEHLGEGSLEYRATGQVHLASGWLREIPFTGHGQLRLRE
jgi:LEA14-like dessication related protein